MKSRFLFALFFLLLGVDLVLVGRPRIGGCCPRRFSAGIWPTSHRVWSICTWTIGRASQARACGSSISGRARGVSGISRKTGGVYARISTFERIVYDFKKHHPMPDLLDGKYCT